MISAPPKAVSLPAFPVAKLSTRPDAPVAQEGNSRLGPPLRVMGITRRTCREKGVKRRGTRRRCLDFACHGESGGEVELGPVVGCANRRSKSVQGSRSSSAPAAFVHASRRRRFVVQEAGISGGSQQRSRRFSRSWRASPNGKCSCAGTSLGPPETKRTSAGAEPAQVRQKERLRREHRALDP